MTTQVAVSGLLRLSLIGDALASGATGLLMAGGAGALTGLLGLPEQLMRWAGLALLPYALFVGFVGTRAMASRAVVWTIVAVNAVWAIDSFLLLAAGWVAPTALGVAFVAMQALAVAGFAAAQMIGLRRADPADALTPPRPRSA